MILVIFIVPVGLSDKKHSDLQRFDSAQKSMFAAKSINSMLPLSLTFLLGMVFLTGCRREETTVLYIDSNLREYFDRFAEEGNRRGLHMDYNTIRVEGFISNTLAAGINGQCQHDENHPDRVLVSQDYWNRASAMEKEFLVFHELGHCYLKRSHLDTQDSSGTCTSIMHSGAHVCRNGYAKQTRDTYLDELFNAR
jgi:hypothetical protein